MHFWAEPRVFYTVSIYNLATIGRRRSQQGIYNDDAGHIGWPFVHVLGASSLFDSGSEIRPSIGRAPTTHLEMELRGTDCHVATIGCNVGDQLLLQVTGLFC